MQFISEKNASYSVTNHMLVTNKSWIQGKSTGISLVSHTAPLSTGFPYLSYECEISTYTYI